MSEQAKESEAARTFEVTLADSPLIGCVVVIGGPETGRRFPFKRRLVIGRGVGADMQLDYFTISRRHAIIRRVGESEFVIEDLGSQNGTKVNGTRISSPVMLRIGDFVELGSHAKVRLTLLDPVEEQVMQSHQMELIGRLSSGVIHDINSLLTVLMGAAGELRELPEGTTLAHESAQACLRDIETATQRAAELTKRLNGLTRSEGVERESVDLSALCDEVLQLAQRTFPATIRVHAELEPRVHIEGVRSHLHQMLLNPCINARDAMPDGGVLTLKLERVSGAVDAEVPAAASQIRITVSDTGAGMDEATRARVFEPFFTTKARGHGTGLGLATVHKVALDHGGRVEIESVPGKGTALQLWLPGEAPAAPELRGSQTLPLPGAPRPAQPVVLTNVDDDSAPHDGTPTQRRRRP